VTAVGVLVPVYDQAAFLPRALEGLVAQDVADWTALVLDDGSPDASAVDDVVRGLGDPRVRLLRWAANRGLGATLNSGLDALDTPLVAYLPADDGWSPGHLAALLRCLAGPDVVLARSGLAEPPDTAYEQLVQVAHRVTADRWTERAELESDDLGRLMWDRLRARGRTADTGRVTCSWTRHPGQRSAALRESRDGGLNVFRSRYRVREPLRFASSDGGDVDEVARYARFRSRSYPPATDGL
jgi:glycosyltransferase involved in cell wall biosynthesis